MVCDRYNRLPLIPQKVPPNGYCTPSAKSIKLSVIDEFHCITFRANQFAQNEKCQVRFKFLGALPDLLKNNAPHQGAKQSAMETTLKELALRGARNLFSYIENADLEDEVGAEAIAATLCQLLIELEQQHPGIAAHYGWHEQLPEQPLRLSKQEALKLISLFAA